MVDFLFSPWKGSDPVSISYWVGGGGKDRCKHCWHRGGGRTGVRTAGIDVATHHEHSKAPPVCSGAVTLPIDHLWGHVLHRATERVGLLVLYCLFAQTKVCRRMEKGRGGGGEVVG